MQTKFWPDNLGLRPLAFWDCGFKSRRRHRCLSLVSFVCFQVEVSASGWLLIQRSPTECGVSERDHESSIMRRPWPTMIYCAIVKKPERKPLRWWGDDGGVHWSQVAAVQVRRSVVVNNCNTNSNPSRDRKSIEYIWRRLQRRWL